MFQAFKFATDTPFLFAIAHSESPLTTVYVPLVVEPLFEFPAGGVVGFVGAVVVPPLMVSFCPTKIVSVVKLFHAFKFATDTPFLFAIAHSESPLTTVYVPLVEPALPLLLPVFPAGGVVGGVQ
ncbi:hypothetical protein [Carnobacterium divergens]|uniref:hypothetical protein n=1 Tax=Carnobacterium divergens TaxID=2748 RepID=UPI001931079A